MVIWVAVGGRGTLFGSVLGAVVVNAAQTAVSESFPDLWQYALGTLIVCRSEDTSTLEANRISQSPST
jgi:urea transport system permease protein